MKTTELPDRAHLKVEEVAQYLEVHPATVRSLMRSEKLQGVKLGRRWFIAKDSLLRLVEGTDAASGRCEREGDADGD